MYALLDLSTGVGKTSLVHILCHDDVLSNPAYTIGCSVEVRLHDYTKVPSAPSYYIEFWDVGGTLGHEKGRPIFYNSVNGEQGNCVWDCNDVFLFRNNCCT